MLLPHTGWFRHEPGDEVVRMIREGHFEGAEQAFLWRFLRPGDTVIDAGAHIGIYSVLAWRALGGEGRVVAFEPTPATVRLLRQNLEANDAGRVEVVEAALWSKKTRLNLTSFKKGMSAHNFAAHQQAKGAVGIAALDLVSHCEAAGIKRIDLLKIDTEGAEPEVLAGARPLLKAGACDTILVEFTEENLKRAGSDSTVLASILRESGYSLWMFEDSTGNLVPFESEGPVWYRNVLAMRDTGFVKRRIAGASETAARIAADILGRAAACKKFKELEQLEGLKRKAKELDNFREWAERSDRIAGELKARLADSDERSSALKEAIEMASSALEEDQKLAANTKSDPMPSAAPGAIDMFVEEAAIQAAEARQEALDWMERTLAWRKLDQERESALATQVRRGEDNARQLAREINETRAALEAANRKLETARAEASEAKADSERRHEAEIQLLQERQAAATLDLEMRNVAAIAALAALNAREAADIRKFHESQLAQSREAHGAEIAQIQALHAEAAEGARVREAKAAQLLAELERVRHALDAELEAVHTTASFERRRAENAEARIAKLLLEAHEASSRIARLESACSLWSEKHGQLTRASTLLQAHFDAVLSSRDSLGGTGVWSRILRSVPRVSVVICTHNPKARLLGLAIRSIAAQSLPPQFWELIVVDNASDPPVNFKHLGIKPVRGLRIVREPRPGLTNARIAGFAASRAPLIVCVDDDNVLATDYLEKAVAIADGNPDIGVFGGSSDPVFETPPADWVRPILPNLALRHYGHEPITAAAMHWGKWEPIGAGMVLRREVASKFSQFILERSDAKVLGRTGKNLLGAEDSLIARIAVRNAFKVSYQPSLALLHHIPSRRVHPHYLRRLMFSQGRSHVILSRLTGQSLIEPLTGAELVRHLRALRKWRINQEGPSGRIQWFWDLGFYHELVNGKVAAS